MIKNIIFHWRYIKFNNKREFFSFNPPAPYYWFVSAFQLKDGFICIFTFGPGTDDEEVTDEQRRRNVFKINDEGKIVWQVADHYKIWKKKIDKNSPQRKAALRACQKRMFEAVRRYDDKIVLVQAGDTGFIVDPDSGALEYWKTSRGGL